MSIYVYKRTTLLLSYCITDLVVGAGFNETVVVLRYFYKAVLVISVYILFCVIEHVQYFNYITRYNHPCQLLMLTFVTVG